MSESGDMLAPCATELERLVQDYLERSAVPGASVGIIVDQHLLWSFGDGLTRFDEGRRPDHRTLYQIASITKTFTATAVLQLRDQGLLSLDDPLVRHVPELDAVQSRYGSIELVTIRQVLQHSAGLQGEVPNRDVREWTLLPMDELLGSLDQVTVAVPPATRFKYSNLGYRLLSEVVGRLSGREFWDYLRDEILQPLGMVDTTPEPGGRLAVQAATGHQAREFDERPAPEPEIGPHVQAGAGGLWSTVHDLARWMAQQFRTDDALQRGPGQVLHGPGLLEMQRPVVVEDETMASARGLGWRLARRGEATLVEHGGHVAGFMSDVCFCPVDRIAAVVLTNGTAAVPPWEFTPRLLEIARPHVRAASLRDAQSVVPPRTEWLELLGSYRAPGGWFDGRVEARGGKLVFVPPAPGSVVRLQPTSDPLCFVALDGRPVGDIVRFFRGDDGAIEGLNVAGFPLARLRQAFDHPAR